LGIREGSVLEKTTTKEASTKHRFGKGVGWILWAETKTRPVLAMASSEGNKSKFSMQALAQAKARMEEIRRVGNIPIEKGETRCRSGLAQRKIEEPRKFTPSRREKMGKYLIVRVDEKRGGGEGSS